jgi:hypothetical protein
MFIRPFAVLDLILPNAETIIFTEAVVKNVRSWFTLKSHFYYLIEHNPPFF